ncbi:General transcription factor II-I repeat domain-containing protein 2-like 1 [Homarus americanus]|uniref:General transcription factor II-I repeat domain-containing protein 2-like 1 n=1 Tax=Homarus americanus TaxID=6706 RepID=A0A8J5JI34_HOMAM|nr:General transcription factor II-I repeat domain-containing protein 2-like 1 [Homarus americanus]
MAEDLSEQLNKDIHECVFFSLQFDESTDVVDTSQLCIFMRIVFKDMSTKEELLKIIPSKGKTRDEDLFQTFSDFVNSTQLPVKMAYLKILMGHLHWLAESDAMPLLEVSNKIKAFRGKTEIWRMRVLNGIADMFPQLTEFWDTNKLSVELVRNPIRCHLTSLK